MIGSRPDGSTLAEGRRFFTATSAHSGKCDPRSTARTVKRGTTRSSVQYIKGGGTAFGSFGSTPQAVFPVLQGEIWLTQSGPSPVSSAERMRLFRRRRREGLYLVKIA